MKNLIFILLLSLFGLNDAKPVSLICLTKDTIVSLPIICFDEIKEDSSRVIDKDTFVVSLNLFNTKQILTKTNDNIVESYCERELLINYLINREPIFKTIVSKDSLRSLFIDSLGSDFLKRSLLYYANIKYIRKDYIKIFLSLSVPDTDYTNGIIIYIRKAGDHTIELDNNE